MSLILGVYVYDLYSGRDLGLANMVGDMGGKVVAVTGVSRLVGFSTDY